MDSQQMQRFPFPLTISMVGNGIYEISSNPPYENSKLKYSGIFVEYDSWERLYKYRSVEKWYPGGVKRNDSPEYTTETFITCRKKLSDFANGLRINPDDLNEDFEINIKEITTSKWTEKEVTFKTIVPFDNYTTINYQKPIQNASSNNIVKTSLYRAVLKKVPVFDEPSLYSNSFPHDFYDQRFACQELRNGFIFAISEYLGGRIWYGWIHTSALVKFGECWIENGRMESLLINDENLSADSAKLIMNENKQWIEESARMVIESVEEYTAKKAKSKSNDTKKLKADSPSSLPDSIGITTSAVYFKVIAEKAYFYDEPNYSFRRQGYLVSGKQFLSLYSKNGFVYTVLTSVSGIQTKGWIRIEDVIKYEL